jgi:hypothetical protein
VGQRLVGDAVALGEADQRLDLLGGCPGVQVEGEADGTEPAGCLLAHGQGTAEAQVALGGDGAPGQGDPQRGGDGAQGDPAQATSASSGLSPRGAGPMLRSGSPDLVAQELAAWAAATGLTRGVVLDAALAAVPARKGRRAGLTVRPRDLSHARAVRAVLSAVRLGHDCYQAVTSEIAKYRTVVDRDRHRARKSKSPSPFAHAGPADTVTRIAPAIITMANTPA